MNRDHQAHVEAQLEERATMYTNTLTLEVAISQAISLKRIADSLEGLNMDGFKNQLLDIAYQAGINFRGQS